MKQNSLVFWQKIGVLASFVLMLVVNVLSNTLPINQTTAEVAATYDNLFVPAGYTFAIWGVIYLLLTAYLLFLFGVFKKFKIDEAKLTTINWLFILLNVLNASWIFAWHFEVILLSAFIIVGMLLSLIFINLEIKKLDLTKEQTLFIKIPFAVYFGWLTIATVANMAALFVFYGFNGLGIAESVWTVLIILVATAIAFFTTLRLNCYAYALTIIWALVGILVNQFTLRASNYLDIIITTILSIVLLVGLLVYMFINNRKQKV